MTTPAPITDAGLADLERLEEAATEGPWSFANGVLVRVYSLADEHYQEVVAGAHKIGGSQDTARANAAFIAAARTEWPSLVHRLRTSEAELAIVKPALLECQRQLGAAFDLRDAQRERAEKAEAEVARLKVLARWYQDKWRDLVRSLPPGPAIKQRAPDDTASSPVPPAAPAGDHSHLGPTCNKRDREHRWQNTSWGRICIECKITERSAPAGDREAVIAKAARELRWAAKRWDLKDCREFLDQLWAAVDGGAPPAPTAQPAEKMAVVDAMWSCVEKATLPDSGYCSQDHLFSMLSRMRSFEEDGKFNRWLGYIQGVLVATNNGTVEQFKNMNRSPAALDGRCLLSRMERGS